MATRYYLLILALLLITVVSGMGIFQEFSHQIPQDGGLKTNCNHFVMKESTLKRDICVSLFGYHTIITVDSNKL